MTDVRRPVPAIYNPHLLSKDDLLRLFVARQPLLERLLDDLRRGGSQHHLLIGPRGSGKTTLLWRLAYAIDDDSKLSRAWIPLLFPEEQYNVSRLSDFWTNCLDALSDALEKRGRREEAAVLDAEVDRLSGRPEAERADAALRILLEWGKRAKRGFVLLLDNIDLLLERLEEHHWTLRDALSEEKRLVVVGASSSAIKSTFEYKQAFYEFFRIEELRGLTQDEARDVILHFARERGAARVTEIVERDPGRFRALHLLTGGNPRTLVLLFGVLELDVAGGVHEDLERLLDQCTPLYKARFEDLPAQSQQIVDALALNWNPIRAGDLAEKLHLEVNLVSAQLARLVQQGVVEKVELPAGSKTGFQMAERFFNIWYLMRASRRLRRRLIWLVECLRLLYGVDELKRQARGLLRREVCGGPAERLHVAEATLAYGEALNEPVLRRALDTRALEMLMEGEETTRDLTTWLDLAGRDAHVKPTADRKEALREIEQSIMRAGMTWGDSSAESVARWLMGDPGFTLQWKRELAAALRRAPEQAPASLLPLMKKRTRPMENARLAPLCEAVRRGLIPTLTDLTEADLDDVAAAAQILNDHWLWLPVLVHLGGRIAPSRLGHLINRVADSMGELERDQRSAPNEMPVGGVSGMVLVATCMAPLNWRNAAALLKMILMADLSMWSPDAWRDLLQLARLGVHDGRACELADLLQSLDYDVIWAPLYHALRAVAGSGRGDLLALAAEMRTPAEEIFDQLVQAFPLPPSTPSTKKTKNRPPSKRQAGTLPRRRRST
jgi:hypothetical protein